jgi:predicted small lipoprotein YifL
MRRFMASASLVPLLLAPLAGCGTQPDGPPEKPPAATKSSSDGSAKNKPSKKPSPTPPPETTDPKDCFDAECTLKVTKPVTIPLDKKKFHYPEMKVVAFDSKSLSYQVDYPGGGGAQQVLSPGGGSGFGFRSNPSVEVKLLSITKGTARLSLTPDEKG